MSKKLLKLKSTREMWTAQNTADGQPTTRGLGFIVGGSARSLKISHNGTQDETRTRMVLYPNKGHGMVVMCNCRDADPGAITTAVYKAINEK